MLKTVHFPTASALEKVLRTSAGLCHKAFLAMRNHASSGPSSSPRRAAASFSLFRLMTCMYLPANSHYANYYTSQNAKLSSLERVNPRHARPDNQRVNVVCALIRFHRFQIHQMPHDRVIVSHSVGSEDVAGQARALQRHPDIVSLRHRDVLVLHFA